MRWLLTIKDVIIIVALSLIFSQVSWWVLFTTKKAQELVRPELAQSVEQVETASISALPSTFILGMIAYFPFWAVTFSLIRVFINLEKHHSRVSPLQQQTL